MIFTIASEAITMTQSSYYLYISCQWFFTELPQNDYFIEDSIDCLMQKRCNSSALAMVLHFFFIKPSI